MTRTQFCAASEAAALIKDGDTVAVCGNGAGMCAAEAILAAIETRFLETGHVIYRNDTQQVVVP